MTRLVEVKGGVLKKSQVEIERQLRQHCKYVLDKPCIDIGPVSSDSMADVVFTGWIRAMYWHGIFHVLSGPNQTKARTRNWSSEWDLCTNTAPRCWKSMDWEIHPPGCHHWVVSFMTNVLTNWTCADTRIICRYHLSLYSTMCNKHFAFWCMLNLLHLSVR